MTSDAGTNAVDAEHLQELVVANRILFDQGVVDAFGHVSMRHPANADRFLLARNMAPRLVTADDILEFGMDGEPVAAAGRAVYIERYIHSEIYRARPDVKAVVHSHAQAVIPFGVVAAAKLRPLFHMGAFLGEGCPVFEIRDTAGRGSDLLIRSRELGAALARDLGQRSSILMRGHGATIAADGLRRAVYRAIYMQMNAALQTTAMQLGDPEFLTPEESEAAVSSVEGQIDRAWTMWRLKVEGKLG
jgi:HCOMODA/2-hydroxy-3-carboxy-muconic semialdehyde decarboxylase